MIEVHIRFLANGAYLTIKYPEGEGTLVREDGFVFSDPARFNAFVQTLWAEDQKSLLTPPEGAGNLPEPCTTSSSALSSTLSPVTPLTAEMASSRKRRRS